MRFLLAITVCLSTACATTSGPRPINVASVRHEINDTIHAENGDRDVTSMGKVREDRATVYTTNKAGVRQEESWVKDGGHWKLEKSSAMN